MFLRIQKYIRQKCNVSKKWSIKEDPHKKQGIQKDNIPKKKKKKKKTVKKMTPYEKNNGLKKKYYRNGEITYP